MTSKGKSAGAFVEALEGRNYLAGSPLDPTFGPAGGGVATHGLRSPTTDHAGASVLQPDGKLVVAGVTGPTESGHPALVVARFLPDGSADTTFGPGRDGRVLLPFDQASEARALALGRGGEIVAGLQVGSDFVVARFRADGTPDATFGPGGAGFARVAPRAAFSYILSDLVVRPDGRVLAGGYAYTLANRQNHLFVQLRPDGAADAAFGTGGTVVAVSKHDGRTNALHLFADGTVVAAGESRGDATLFRLTPGGRVDKSFGTRGWVRTDFGSRRTDAANAVAALADGRIVLAGASGGRFAVARYTADGRLDESFGAGGKVVVDFGESFARAWDLAPQSDGKVVVAGETEVPLTVPPELSGPTAFAVARLTATGQLDPTFGDGGRAVVDFTPGPDRAVGVHVREGDGKIFLAGSSWYPNPDLELARLNADGRLDLTFGAARTGKVTVELEGPASYSVSDAVQLPDGKVLAIGSYEDPVIGSRLHLTRFNADGSIDAAFGRGGSVFVDGRGAPSDVAAAVHADGRVVLAAVVNQGDLMNRRSRLILFRVNPGGSLDPTFGPGGTGVIETEFTGGGVPHVVVDAAGHVVTAAFDERGYRVARFTPAGSLDASFGVGGIAELPLSDPQLYFSVDGITLGPEGRIVLAGHTADRSNRDHVPRLVLARLTAGGAYDASFSPGGADGDGRVVVPVGGKDFQYSPVPVAVQGDGRMVVAVSTWTDAPSSDTVVFRFTEAGAADTTFGAGGRVVIDRGGYDRASDVVVTADGKILVLGITGRVGEGFVGDVVVTRLDAAGVADGGFGDGGTAVVPLGSGDKGAARLTILPDGTALAVGKAGNDIFLARFVTGAPARAPVTATLDGRTLTITGTPGPDGIRLANAGGRLTVAGLATSFPTASFSRIVIRAGAGDDAVDASAATAPVTIDAGDGADVILGGAADDTLSGGAGDDTLFGGGGADVLQGDDGNDYLNGGPGADRVYGGAGNDQVFAVDGGTDAIDGGAGFDRGKSDADDLLTGVDAILT